MKPVLQIRLGELHSDTFPVFRTVNQEDESVPKNSDITDIPIGMFYMLTQTELKFKIVTYFLVLKNQLNAQLYYIICPSILLLRRVSV
jgi:hypothetical protein